MAKVLQFAYGLNSGGIEAFVTNLNSCREVFPEPFDFLLYSTSEHKDFYEEANIVLGSHIYKLGDDCSKIFWINCLQKRMRAYRFMKMHHYDVVHIHNSNVFCILEAIIAKAAGVKKVIVHSHNTTMGSFGLRRKVKQIFQVLGRPLWPLFADEYCACSTEAGIWMFGETAVENGKVHILKNGIIGENYYYNERIREEYRSKLGWNDRYIIGHVGRFSNQKNHIFLLDIFDEIVREEPKARLVLFGEGELKNKIEKKAMDLGLTEYINFYGTSNEINRWLQAMDLFLFPSLYEGLPVSGIEAQAAGVPLLASDTISPELKITNNVKWQNLSASAELWAKEAVFMLRKEWNRDTRAQIRYMGYDIRETSKVLKKMYVI